MKLYAISLAAGVLVGIIYATINVRSPAPSLIALIGLLGILVGEQVVPIAKRIASPEPVSMGWLRSECLPNLLGTSAQDGLEAPSKSSIEK